MKNPHQWHPIISKAYLMYSIMANLENKRDEQAQKKAVLHYLKDKLHFGTENFSFSMAMKDPLFHLRPIMKVLFQERHYLVMSSKFNETAKFRWKPADEIEATARLKDLLNQILNQ